MHPVQTMTAWPSPAPLPMLGYRRLPRSGRSTGSRSYGELFQWLGSPACLSRQAACLGGSGQRRGEGVRGAVYPSPARARQFCGRRVLALRGAPAAVSWSVSWSESLTLSTERSPPKLTKIPVCTLQRTCKYRMNKVVHVQYAPHYYIHPVL